MNDTLNQIKVFNEKIMSWTNEVEKYLTPSMYEVYNLLKKFEEESKYKAKVCHIQEMTLRKYGFFDAADFWRQRADCFKKNNPKPLISKEFWFYLMECQEKVCRAEGLFDEADYYRQMKHSIESSVHIAPWKIIININEI
jgi:hypothetical protein